MKKVFVLCIGVLLFASCEQDTIVPEIEEISIDQSSFAKGGDKVDVCHKGKIINVSVNAVSAHQGHGDAVDIDGDGYFDLESPCSEVDCDDTAYSEDNSCVPEIGDCRDGGVVFYVAGENEDLNGDGIADLGLVVAIESQGSAPWNNGSSFEIGVNNYAIGTGFTNTNAIIAAQGTVETDYAAGLARAYNGGGYTNWFLPSGGEMLELYLNKDTVNAAIIDKGGTTVTGTFWTSTEEGDDDATDTSFTSGFQTTSLKGSPFDVRAARAF